MRLVPVAGVTYLLSWFGWFMNPSAYKHGWAAAERAAGRGSWLPDSIADFIEYHRAIYKFHVGLSTPHSYMAKPSGWLLQMRPTSFYWQSNDTLGADAYQCDTRNCVRAITRSVTSRSGGPLSWRYLWWLPMWRLSATGAAG